MREAGGEIRGRAISKGARGGSIYQKAESTIAIGEYQTEAARAHLAMLTHDPRRDEGRGSKYLEPTSLTLLLFLLVSPTEETNQQSECTRARQRDSSMLTS